MGIYSLKYKRHFKSQKELDDYIKSLQADKAPKEEKKVAPKPPVKKDEEDK